MLAPFANLSAADQRELDAIGPRWGVDIQRHRDRVLAIYAPYLARAPKAGVEVTRDVAYGAHPRQVLDVFRPATGRNLPVVIFLHGGAFVRGNKCVDQEVYANVLYFFARHGCLGINAEYRLAPEIRYPGIAEDVGGMVRWAQDNAERLGGDPNRIVLVGHSAGGTHVASYVLDPRARPEQGHGVRAMVLLSARLRADARADNPNAAGVRAYYGDDPGAYDAASPVSHVDNLDIPVLLANAEYENPLLDIYGAEFLHRVARLRARAPRFLQLARHNHITMAAHFNTEEDALGCEILDFIARAG